jgi:hypothetical protein
MVDAGEKARRSFAAFALRMISGYVLYRDSPVKSQQRVARIGWKWIVTRGKKHTLTFDSVFDDILDISPDAMRERIKKLCRDDFLRKAKECVEDEEAKLRRLKEAAEAEADDAS